MRSIILLVLIFSSLLSAAQQKVELHQGWMFRQQGDPVWRTARVPGNIHTDLLSHQIIPDPFFRDHEKDVQWVEKKAWEYRLVFSLPRGWSVKDSISLQFDGIDTEAEIWLNGQLLGTVNNMFRGYSFSPGRWLQISDNMLEVHFPPPSAAAMAQKQKEKLIYPDNERIYVRKAQYQFGWDWGPRLVTCGIWKPVKLVRGKQSDKFSSKYWKVELKQERDDSGSSFYFTRHGKPVYIKGANWIPAESFLPRMSKQRYRHLLMAAKEAGLNMLRVWGGGVYEDDAFYTLCDSLQIMVWQDFMFAGALYPANEAFLRNVEQEIRYQVNRLKQHPCIVLWCGNNEIEEAWFNWGWQQQYHYSQADSIKLWNDYRSLFHELIPKVLKELDPGRPYWPSSPSLGWGRDSAYRQGDVHYWGVWWGKEPVEKYRQKVGRFNSEFGMQGMPSFSSIQRFTQPQDWDTSSAVMKTHQKHPFGWENIATYISNRFPQPQSFSDLVYISQLMQADAMQIAIEAQRSQQPYSMGSLVWQWNDCWPVTSWSAIDYYGHKKALYYQLRRSYKNELLMGWVENKKLFIHRAGEWGDTTKYVCRIYRMDMAGNRKLVKSSTMTTGRSFISDLPAGMDTTRELLIVEPLGIQKESLTVLPSAPRRIKFEKPLIQFSFQGSKLEVTTNKPAYGIWIQVPEGVEVSDNYFNLVPGVKKEIGIKSNIPLTSLKQKITIRSLADTY